METKVNFRTRQPDTHERVTLVTSGKTRAQQSFKDECDINNIMRKYRATGLVPQRGPGEFLDVSAGLDFQAALHLVQEARETFDDLPAHVRKEFDYSPSNMVDFLQNPENREKAIELGLVEAPAADPPPSEVSPASEPPPQPLAEE